MSNGQILLNDTPIAADRADLRRLQMTNTGLLIATNNLGANVPIVNIGAPASLPMTSILALSPATYSGVTFEASDYYDVQMKSDGTRWRPKGGMFTLFHRARSDVDRVTIASGAGQFDYIYTVPAWVLELSNEVRVEAKVIGGAITTQTTGVRESSLQVLVDGNALIAPAAGTNSLSVSEFSVMNSGNVKTAQVATKSGTGRTGLGASVDLLTQLAINNRTWNINIRLLNGPASTAENTLKMDSLTIVVYVG